MTRKTYTYNDYDTPGLGKMKCANCGDPLADHPISRPCDKPRTQPRKDWRRVSPNGYRRNDGH